MTSHIKLLIAQILSLIVKIRIALIGIPILWLGTDMFIFHPLIAYDTLYSISKGIMVLFGIMCIMTIVPKRYRIKVLRSI